MSAQRRRFDFPVLFFSFLVSVIIYFAISRETQETLVLDADIRVHLPATTDEDKVRVMQDRDRVKIRLKGPLKEIDLLRQDRPWFDIVLNPDELEAGKETKLHLELSQLRSNRGSLLARHISLESNPGFLSYTVDEIIDRDLDIKHHLDMNNEKFDIEFRYLNPRSILVTGPKSLVGALEGIDTKFTKLSNIRYEHVDRVTLQLINPDPEKISFSDQRVIAYLNVTRKKEERLFKDITVRRITPALDSDSWNIEINPNTVDIKVRGPKILDEAGREFAKLNNEDIRASIDLFGITSAGTYPQKVDIILPPGCEQVGETRVEVILTKKP